MNNRRVYQKDPSAHKLVNEGVANVNDNRTNEAMAVLRYELETFVCDGQYERGLVHILETYLKNIDQAQQPAVWISGFYGSGKSHLVKMLRALWTDITFEDGATARGVANLPNSVKDNLKELSVTAARHGGLHAASGTLGSGASGSVRLALLGIVFKSAGLPELYSVAHFVMWLKREGIYDQVRSLIEANGGNWEEELANFYVSEDLGNALVSVKPNMFASLSACFESLNNMFPLKTDVSNDEMTRSIKQALSVGGELPLTVIILDEIQQFIGSSVDRSIEVQELVETLCKNIGGKLLFIGTGQTALSGIALLARLQGRFTVRVELSDADVDAVVRQVILAKKPEAISPLEKVMTNSLGEISRHLGGTALAHRQSDTDDFVQDYPILPTRRRFWESTLRVLDQTGSDSQLRNQLSMVHKAIQTNLDMPLGHVIPADYLYFDSADKLLQSRTLPREVYRQTMIWRKGSEDEKLMARACGLVFLVNKLGSQNKEVGIKATVDTLADLMIEDLASGSSKLRSRLPGLLDKCELLIKVGDEYRIQTEESLAWQNEYLNHKSNLANEAHRVDEERNLRIRSSFAKMVGKTNMLHGKAKVPRSLHPVFDNQLPADANKKICIWVRDGWCSDEKSVMAEAREAGAESPTIFVFVPRRSADELRNNLIDSKAASATLDARGVPTSPEGIEARSAMETILNKAEASINNLLKEAFSTARVFQGGGSDVVAESLQAAITKAAEDSLVRLYPQFEMADFATWDRVYDKAKKGASDALKEIGFEGEAPEHQVCRIIKSTIGSSKSGSDIRSALEESPYGWSRDAVDGGLQTMLVAGQLVVLDERGQPIAPDKLERRAIGRAIFKAESVTLTVVQRIKVRQLMQKVGVTAKNNEELQQVPAFIGKLQELASQAGGEAPKPVKPDTKLLEEIRLKSGNEQLLSICEASKELESDLTGWRERGERISSRLPNWVTLQALLEYGVSLPEVKDISLQGDTIREGRQLLAEPDLIKPLLGSLTQIMRDALNKCDSRYKEEHGMGIARLDGDESWQKLKPEQRAQLLLDNKLHEAAKPAVDVKDTEAILATLKGCSLAMFADRIAALPTRFESVAREAARLCEPQAQFMKLPRRTLRTNEEIDVWIEEVKQLLKAGLSKGPITVE